MHDITLLNVAHHNTRCRIINLPNEILDHIAVQAPTLEAYLALGRVNHIFNELVSSESKVTRERFVKEWISSQLNGRYEKVHILEFMFLFLKNVVVELVCSFKWGQRAQTEQYKKVVQVSHEGLSDKSCITTFKAGDWDISRLRYRNADMEFSRFQNMIFKGGIRVPYWLSKHHRNATCME
ncbi:hypothetical protein BJ508DRAFT_312801 [Ascobolus immersus RN42]|uniref:F-box domain-containing protein n=1 Tax=Ascobolus immersus RN42 TaxID=1160509 RepID=A0A3N4HRT8_ASCIM|nr:hypothetical protein BJ508DRAFT_312801 [Ascobolus immersus RN42]